MTRAHAEDLKLWQSAWVSLLQEQKQEVSFERKGGKKASFERKFLSSYNEAFKFMKIFKLTKDSYIL